MCSLRCISIAGLAIPLMTRCGGGAEGRCRHMISRMGSYDTFIDGNMEAQSKAFGKHLRTYHPGDTVVADRAPLSAEELDQWIAGGTYAETPAAGSYQAWALLVEPVAGHDRAYITIRDDVFRELTPTRAPELPLLNGIGEVVN